MKKNHTEEMLLGKIDEHNKLYTDGYQPIALIAPHGTGKGVCHVIPNLLHLEDSCIVHDIKLENFQLTSDYRKSIGHKVFIFNPCGKKNKTSRYNPLDFINVDESQIVYDLLKLSSYLIKNADAKQLFASLALYLKAMNKPCSIGQIARIVQSNAIEEIKTSLKNKALHVFAHNYLESFLNKDSDERKHISKSLLDAIYIFTNPLIDYATSASDFNITSMKTEKITVYVGGEPEDVVHASIVFQMFYAHAFDKLMDKAREIGHTSNNGHVSLFLDDFCAYGKIENFVGYLPYLRGYKIRVLFISHDISSIENIYGACETKIILGSCGYKIFFAPQDFYNAKKISKLAISRVNNTEILSWQATMTMNDRQLLVRTNEEPIITVKYKYYEDKLLQDRINV